MEINGIEFTLVTGEKIRVEISDINSIQGWWLYKDGKTRINEVVTAITYTRTVTSPNQP